MISRRHLVAAAAASAAAIVPLRAAAQARPASAAGSGHDPFGPVRPPQAPPPVQLTTHLGQPAQLAALLAGKVTALQLMFTGCSATCPIQGAIFAGAQQRLGSGLRGAQWISLSIDPLPDDPPALTRWLQRFGAGPGWTAVRPRFADLDPLLDFLDGRAKSVDRHVGQAFLFDRQGRLVYRTVDMPAPGDVVDLMKQVAELG